MMTIPEHATIELLKESLSSLGYTYQTIVLNDNNYTQFTSPAGVIWFTSNTHINYPFATSTARSISDKKHLAYQLAESLGVRVPQTYVIDTAHMPGSEDIQTWLQAGPLVIKPDNASLSHGLTLQVTTESGLLKAIDNAKEYSETVLVQEQVSGEELRFVVINGVVTSALLRQTPRIVGDGVSTASQLLDKENDLRRSIQVPYLTYPLLTEELIDTAQFESTKVLAKGQVYELGKSTMIRGGCSVYDVISSVDASYVDTATRLANSLGKGFIVVDMFIEDYKQPKSETNHAFIEFNMSPVLKLCYSCRDDKQYDVLADLVPLIDRSLHYGEIHD